MNQISFDPYVNIEFQRRHKELLREAERARLVSEAKKAGMGKSRNTSKILAMIGRELTSFGAGLVQRYNHQPEAELVASRQSDPGVCA